MNIKERIFLNTSIQILGKIFSISLSLVSIFLLTRHLGVGGYGNFTLVFSYLAIFSLLSDMGLSLLFVRDYANSQQESNSLFFYLLLKIFLTIFSTLLAILLLFFVPYSNEIKLAIFIASIAVAISGITSFGTSVFQAKLRMDLVTLIDQITKFITVLSIFIFIQLELNFYFIISSVFLGNFVGLLITIYLLKQEIKIFFNKSKTSTTNLILNRKFLKNGLLIGIMTFLAFSYFKADSIILSLYKTPEDLGIYGLAYKIIENILLFWGFYMASIFPIFSKYSNNNPKKFNDIFVNSIELALVSSFICILIGIFKADMIVQLFGGKGFMQSIIPLKILLFSIPFFLTNNILYYSFIAKYRIKEIIICLFIALIFNILLNVIFVPKYGYLASSYITVLTEILLFICYSFLYKWKSIFVNYD